LQHFEFSRNITVDFCSFKRIFCGLPSFAQMKKCRRQKILASASGKVLYDPQKYFTAHWSHFTARWSYFTAHRSMEQAVKIYLPAHQRRKNGNVKKKRGRQ
jgi:hypothetical protein